MVGQKAGGSELVAMLRAALLDDTKPVADLHALDRVDPHHRRGKVGIEPAEHGLAETLRHATGAHGDTRADRIPLAPQPVDQLLQLCDPRRVGTKERVAVCRIEIREGEAERARLRQPAVDRHPQPLAQVLARDGTGCDADHRLARGRASATAMVAHSVLLLIGVIGMTRTEAVAYLLVVI